LPVDLKYDTTLAEKAYELAARWDAARDVADPSQLQFASSDLDDFNSNQKSIWLIFAVSQCSLIANWYSCLP
jgi:leukotriene-A4 hydrolase